MEPFQDFNPQPTQQPQAQPVAQPTYQQPPVTLPSAQFGGQAAPNQAQPTTEPAPKKSKLPMILVIAVALELVVIVGLMALVATNSKNTTQTKSNSSNNTQSLAPQPATSVGVQQTDDAVSQTLSSLSEDRDFPADKLSDKNLGL